MATISTTSRDTYAATFNGRTLKITTQGKAQATDTATGEILPDGDELRSIRALVAWHVKSKRQRSELATVATVRKG
jgi:hypothetical protein